MKFKVGDKVVVSLKENPLLGGLSGIVVEAQESPIADTAYYKVDLDGKRVFPERHLIAETEYRFLTGLNATAHQILATCGIKAADSDTKVLRAKDGTIIGEFNTGGVLPTSEWSKLIFKNGSSIEVLPQKDDTVRGENHFCDGFRGGKIPTPDELIKKEFNVKWIKEENKMPTKFTFYTEEGYRIDKSNNSKVETITTFVKINGFDNTYLGMATCDKVDYSEREGVINALANAMCNGNFDREFNKAVKDNARADKKKRTCTYCGQLFDTVEEKQAHEAWHVERKKARRERYLLRKRAKEIAFEEQAQKMAKEMMGEQK